MFNYTVIITQGIYTLFTFICFSIAFATAIPKVFKLFIGILGFTYVPSLAIRFLELAIRNNELQNIYLLVFEIACAVRLLNCFWLIVYLFYKGFIRFKWDTSLGDASMMGFRPPPIKNYFHETKE